MANTNVLVDLFRDIASAIKQKTGDNTSMKPSDFPQRILGINVSGGESGGDSGEVSYSYFSESFQASTQTQTVTHICNKVPDILLVYLEGVPSNNTIFFALGFSQAMLDKLGGGYKNRVTFVRNDGGSMEATSNIGVDKTQSAQFYIDYGGIRDVSDTQMTLGGTTYGLQVDKHYSYIAICGLT